MCVPVVCVCVRNTGIGRCVDTVFVDTAWFRTVGSG